MISFSDLESSTRDTSKVYVPVEVCQKSGSSMPRADLETMLTHLLQANPQWYQHDGILPITASTGQKVAQQLLEHVERIRICPAGGAGQKMFFWQVAPDIHIHKLHSMGPAEDDEAADGVPTFLEWELPAKEFDGTWESLIYDTNIKDRLVRHATTSLHFACAGVDGNIISWNKVALLHGPPGTGKTSLCKALAQKLAIRHSGRYKHGHLIEVNAHSLFSKYFSESGKLVTQLFQKIQEFVDDSSALVFVLVDEVESLTSARKSAMGSEPSDAIRSVNALLTHLDALRAHPNVFVLCTSNLPDAVDIAFVDRADIKAYIGLPSESAIYKILRSCITELVRSQLVHSGTTQIAPPPYPAAVAACKALPDLFSRICGPENAPDASNSDLDNSGASHMNCSAMNGDGVGDNAAQELGDLQLGDLKLDVDMRDQLAVCPEAAQEHGRDSLALVKLGMQLRAVARKCEGLSGRMLRKMPFLAFTLFDSLATPTVSEFVDLLHRTAAQEAWDRAALKSG